MATTTTKPAQAQQRQAPPPLQSGDSKGQVTVIAPLRMAFPVAYKEEFGIGETEWRSLTDAIFPGAKTIEAVGMALAYCKKRGLDIFKRPVHIVTIYSTALKRNVESVWPGINELRTTAMRTKNYAGMDPPTYGPATKHSFGGGKVKKWENGQEFWETEKTLELEFPEWCQITVYRLLQGNRIPFPGPRVYWLETYATASRYSTLPNSMWEKRSNGQLEKCAEAAALRRAFPEEIGDDFVPEEIGAFHTHQAAVDVTDDGSATTAPPTEPVRGQFKDKSTTAKPEDAKAADPAKDPQDKAAKDKPKKAAGGRRGKSDAAKAGPGVTDVEDQNGPQPGPDPGPQDDQTTPAEPEAEPMTFELYTRAGDFFIFADAWLVKPERREAELVAFGSFYADYMNERLDPAFKSKAVHEAMVDTKRLLSEALTRVQAPT